MKNARKIIKNATLVVPVCIAASAQSQILPLNTDNTKVEPTTLSVGGTPAMDMVRLTPGGTGAPLRYGNVIKNSEQVFLNGVKLKAGVDYSIDYAVGVVYVSRTFRDGDGLSIQYRYDAKAPASASGSAVAGLPSMKFNLMPGGLTMQLGFGQTERSADGKVLRTNLWGTRNNFSGSGMGLSGAYFAGSRMEEGVVGGMTYDSQNKGTATSETGKSSFLVQAFNFALGGGAKLTADMQDVSKNFSGFNAVKDAGYTDAQIAAFTRERGLKRQGLGLSDLNVGGLKFSAAQNSVSDGNASIKASSYSMNNGGLSFSHNASEVGRGFTRFQDLGVADWQQKSLSQAIRKSEDVAALKSSFGSLSFTNTRIDDIENKKGIQKTNLGFDSTKFGFSYSTQQVDTGFSRFEADRGVFGLEAGMKRQNFNLTKGILGKDTNITFAQSNLSDMNGEASLDARNIGIKGKTWSLNSSSLTADSKFNRFGSMGTAELDAKINSVAAMYGSATNLGIDRGMFGNSAGISRTNTTFNMNPTATSALKVSSTGLKGATDKGSLDTLDYAAKGLKFNIRKLELGSTFSEVTRLMSFEQANLGTILGMSRTDMGLNLNMGKKGIFDANFLSAKVGENQLDRAKLSYTGQGIEASYNSRKVGQGFTMAGQITDPEQALLATLTGFNQTDSRLKFSPLKNLKLDFSQSKAYNETTSELRESDYLNLDLAVDRNTQFGYTKYGSLNQTSNSTLLAASLERLSMNRKFGNSSLSVTNEKQQFNGQNATPDIDKMTVALETKLDKNTSIRTEQTKTQYSDGNKENINSNTISTQLSKNVGVSVTDTNINRSAANSDETKRNYGFWWDFGKGVRMTYGYVRQLTGDTSGYANTGFMFGQNPSTFAPGQAMAPVNGANLNGTTIGFGSSTNTWDDQLGRTQAFSSFSLATNKPFRVGFLQDSKFAVNSYMASDNSRWLKEDIASSFESHVGKYGVGFQYRGQVDQSGQRSVDRTYRVKTDFSDKAPLSASFTYKQRIMPDNKEYAIRDFQLNWKLSKGFQISNQIQTNPEGPYNPNIVLGTQPLAQRRNIWRADYTGNKNFLFGGQFDEMRDDTLQTIRRTAGVNMSFFQASGSPLNLFYGIEQNDSLAGRNSYVRFGLSFEQKPSVNQVFSLSVGNQGWLQNTDKTLAGTNDWVARLNYQWRIK